jgi:hypothetical protein
MTAETCNDKDNYNDNYKDNYKDEYNSKQRLQQLRTVMLPRVFIPPFPA